MSNNEALAALDRYLPHLPWYKRRLDPLPPAVRKKLHQQGASSSYDAHIRSQCEPWNDDLAHLGRLQMHVPSFYENAEPRMLFTKMESFCREHCLPDEIIAELLPSIMTYIDTGKMRPVIFTGESGCGKTTAARLLGEQILQLPVKVIDVPQADHGRGITGVSRSFTNPSCGELAKALIDSDNLLNCFVLNEVDKCPYPHNRASVNDELLSITDECYDTVIDNYLEIPLVSLRYCPILMTGNDVESISAVLRNRCTVIHFPTMDAQRMETILNRYTQKLLANRCYAMIELPHELLKIGIAELLDHRVTSVRSHQVMVEKSIHKAFLQAMHATKETHVVVTQDMLQKSVKEILMVSSERRMGYHR